MLNKYNQEIDAIQMRSIQRSEQYLRPKDNRREILDWLGYVATFALISWVFLWVL